MVNNLITIILPLWDREVYTSTWIKENVFDDFNYIIADGSKSEKNKKIFEAFGVRPNIKYIRYPFDKDDKAYIKKMNDAVTRVETPYVMTCDNDDFLNYKGVIECIKVLQNYKSFGIAHGSIASVISKNNNKFGKYQISTQKYSPKHLHNKSQLDALQNIFRPYAHIWYGVYRSHLYKKIWNEILISKISDIFLIEIFQVQLAICFAKLYIVDYVHYIRLANPVSNAASICQSIKFSNLDKIYFDNNYRAQVMEMARIVAQHFDVHKDKIYDEYRIYFSRAYSNNGAKFSLKNLMIRIFYKVSWPFFTLKNVRNFLSFKLF